MAILNFNSCVFRFRDYFELWDVKYADLFQVKHPSTEYFRAYSVSLDFDLCTSETLFYHIPHTLNSETLDTGMREV